MLMNTAPALTDLPAAERHLVRAIDGAAAEVNAVATSALDAALAKLEHAVGDARERLAAGLQHMRELVAGLACALEGAGNDVLGGLSAAQSAARAAPAIEPPATHEVLPVAAAPVLHSADDDNSIAPAPKVTAITPAEARREFAAHFGTLAPEGMTEDAPAEAPEVTTVAACPAIAPSEPAPLALEPPPEVATVAALDDALLDACKAAADRNTKNRAKKPRR